MQHAGPLPAPAWLYVAFKQQLQTCAVYKLLNVCSAEHVCLWPSKAPPLLAPVQRLSVVSLLQSVLQWKGGETEALARLHYYFWESKLLSNYKQTRNGMLGGDYSTKFSAWLAHGNISPRTIYHEVGSSRSAGQCMPERCMK